MEWYATRCSDSSHGQEGLVPCRDAEPSGPLEIPVVSPTSLTARVTRSASATVERRLRCGTMFLVTIRRGHPDDSDAIADVWLRSRAASVPPIPPPVHTEEEVRTWFKEVVVPTTEVWVATDGDVIVALLVLEGDWIDQLYVEPDHVGRGYGADLMAVAKQVRPSGLTLWTFEANVRARSFYERHGFVATGATRGENEEGVPDVRYEWRSHRIGTVP